MTRVLVPVAILERESVSRGLAALLGTVDVTVLGYHEVPEQTPPEQLRDQYGERATSALDDLVAEFRAAGGDADHRLVFTPDREQSIDRVAADVGADAVAITGATGDVERLLVSLSGDVAADRIGRFVTAIAADRPIEVTLLSATDEETADPSRIQSVADELTAAGVDVVAVTAVDDSPLDALVEAVPGHDAVVMGERAPSLSSILLGDFADRVASATVGPVLVVQSPPEESTDADHGSADGDSADDASADGDSADDDFANDDSDGEA
jgi:nucleotide-binding universal stress UspA family protein